MRRSLLSETLCCAERILSADNSIPDMVSKYGESVIANNPEPQYVSTKCVGLSRGFSESEPEPGGKIASLTYSVKGTSTELLFWKNDDAGYSKMNPPTFSRIVAV